MQKYSQKGFTLLEATISLLVLSIGMLGISALFFEGLKSGRTAVFRTTAVYLASDMADRIRANPLGQQAYENTGADRACLNGNKVCSAVEIAEEDKLNWSNDVAETMPPDATATVDVTAIAGADTIIYDIKMAWPESGFDEPLTYELKLEL